MWLHDSILAWIYEIIIKEIKYFDTTVVSSFINIFPVLFPDFPLFLSVCVCVQKLMPYLLSLIQRKSTTASRLCLECVCVCARLAYASLQTGLKGRQQHLVGKLYFPRSVFRVIASLRTNKLFSSWLPPVYLCNDLFKWDCPFECHFIQRFMTFFLYARVCADGLTFRPLETKTAFGKSEVPDTVFSWSPYFEGTRFIPSHVALLNLGFAMFLINCFNHFTTLQSWLF